MFKHVGASHYRKFLRKVKDLLNEDGAAPFHRPDGAARQHESLAQEIYLPWRLYPGAVGGAAGGRGCRALGYRYRDPAPALRLHAARMAPALPGQPGQDRGALRRALRADVGVLSRRLRGRLPLYGSDGLPDAARQTPGCCPPSPGTTVPISSAPMRRRDRRLTAESPRAREFITVIHAAPWQNDTGFACVALLHEFSYEPLQQQGGGAITDKWRRQLAGGRSRRREAALLSEPVRIAY